ncbi:MAG: PhzF family phenazine biosynthesis isomerase [Synechocystis sp.]
MRYAFHTLDVFTDQIFGGNPLAVFPNAQGLTSTQMQQIAAEINYSETVFVLPPESKQGDFQLRIFTPTQELDFAGHPTVGTAFLLGKLHLANGNQSVVTWQLEEPVGLVPVTLYYDGESLLKTELTVAQLPQTQQHSLELADLARLLGLRVDQIKHNDDFPQAYSCGLPFLFVPLVNREALGQIQFNLSVWQALLADQWANCVYCLAPADSTQPLTKNQTLYGRMFAPGLGIAEDPATGSAVAALGGYLGDRLSEEGLFTWQIHQGIEMGRPSQLTLTLVKTPQGIETVKVAGCSVLVSEGVMTIPPALETKAKER